jgi:hypothetical protein
MNHFFHIQVVLLLGLTSLRHHLFSEFTQRPHQLSNLRLHCLNLPALPRCILALNLYLLFLLLYASYDFRIWVTSELAF